MVYFVVVSGLLAVIVKAHPTVIRISDPFYNSNETNPFMSQSPLPCHSPFPSTVTGNDVGPTPFATMTNLPTMSMFPTAFIGSKGSVPSIPTMALMPTGSMLPSESSTVGAVLLPSGSSAPSESGSMTLTPTQTTSPSESVLSTPSMSSSPSAMSSRMPTKTPKPSSPSVPLPSASTLFPPPLTMDDVMPSPRTNPFDQIEDEPMLSPSPSLSSTPTITASPTSIQYIAPSPLATTSPLVSQPPPEDPKVISEPLQFVLVQGPVPSSTNNPTVPGLPSASGLPTESGMARLPTASAMPIESGVTGLPTASAVPIESGVTGLPTASAVPIESEMVRLPTASAIPTESGTVQLPTASAVPIESEMATLATASAMPVETELVGVPTASGIPSDASLIGESTVGLPTSSPIPSESSVEAPSGLMTSPLANEEETATPEASLEVEVTYPTPLFTEFPIPNASPLLEPVNFAVSVENISPAPSIMSPPSLSPVKFNGQFGAKGNHPAEVLSTNLVRHILPSPVMIDPSNHETVKTSENGAVATSIPTASTIIFESISPYPSLSSLPSSSVAPPHSLVTTIGEEFSGAKEGEIQSVSIPTASSLVGLTWAIGSPLPATLPSEVSSIVPAPLVGPAIDDGFLGTIEPSMNAVQLPSASPIVGSTENSDSMNSSSQPADILPSPLTGVSIDEEFTITPEPSLQMMPIPSASSLISGDAVVHLSPLPKVSGLTVATSLLTPSESPQGNAILPSLLASPIVEGIMETIEPSDAATATTIELPTISVLPSMARNIPLGTASMMPSGIALASAASSVAVSPTTTPVSSFSSSLATPGTTSSILSANNQLSAPTASVMPSPDQSVDSTKSPTLSIIPTSTPTVKFSVAAF